MNRLRTILALAIAVPIAIIVLMSGCASVTHDPNYDGGMELMPTPSDSVTLVPVTIDNSRDGNTEVINPPMFYLIGNGRHQLARVSGPSVKRVFIDSRWLTGPDGTFQIYVHYAGLGDLYYDRISWRPGESVFVQLTTLFNPVAAWAR